MHAKLNGNSKAIKPLTQCLINMVVYYYTIDNTNKNIWQNDNAAKR